MTTMKLPEMPQAIREMAANNLDQAHALCTHFFDGARKAQESMKTSLPANPMLDGLSGVQERALKFAEQNIGASFSMIKEPEPGGRPDRNDAHPKQACAADAAVLFGSSPRDHVGSEVISFCRLQERG